MVPAAILILTAATLFAKNLCRPILVPHMTDRQVGKLAKITVLSITCAALGSAIFSSTTLVGLLLMGYAVVAQFFPGVVLGLYSQRATMPGVFAGMVTGVFIAVVLVLTDHDPVTGLNAGFIGLCFNFAVTAVVSLLTSTGESGFAREFTSSPAFQSRDDRELT
jgi:SSS family solute:Na+ symporter